MTHEKRLSIRQQRALYRRMAKWREEAQKLRGKLKSRNAKIETLLMEIKAHR